MSVGPAALIAAQAVSGPEPGEGSAWRAPLLSAALAFTVGVLLDRHNSLPLVGSLIAAVVFLIAFVAVGAGRSRGLPLVYLALSVAGFGAAWHHYRRDTHRADDIGWLVADSAQIVQLRGVLD